MNGNPHTLLNWLRAKSPLTQIAVVAGLLALAALLVTGGGVVTSRWKEASYNRREAARMKQVQAALAAAEAATKRAEEKEAQAELLRRQNEAKAGRLAADAQKIAQEGEQREKAIETHHASEVERINAPASDCDRCRDVCTRLDRVAAANPNLAEFRCAPEACADKCPAGQ